MLRKMLLIGLLLVLMGCSPQQRLNTSTETPPAVEVTAMKLTSTAFEHEGKIPRDYTCEGTNVNPPLSIRDVPAGTKSLALIMDDPDAIRPANKVWDHWIVFNMPPTTTEIKEGEQPQGIPGKGTSDNLGYQGPCPPDAEHRYYFKLYALNVLLELPPGVTKGEVEQAMENHILAQATLMGRYEKRESGN